MHDQAVEGRLEYRSGPLARGLRAVAAALATTDRSLFLGAGIAYEMSMGRWDVTPSFVPGLYRHGGGRDLGYPLEFRTQAEVGYRLRRGSRVALAFSHLSNAGLGARNPGQESLTVNYGWRPGAAAHPISGSRPHERAGLLTAAIERHPASGRGGAR